MSRSQQLSVGASTLLLGLLIALAGSLTDDVLGDAAIVMVLQVVLWVAGGILMLAGATSVAPLRLGGADRTERRRALRPTHRQSATHR